MKYTIKEILPAQIKVVFENGSWALVPILPDATVEEIDHEVSKYDPDFLPKPHDLINKNIAVDEERTSLPISEIKESDIESGKVRPPEQNDPQFTPTVRLPVLTFGSAHPIDAVAIGNYFSERGDNRIKDAITKNIEEFMQLSNFSVEKMVNDLKDDTSAIVMQALAELEAEAESKTETTEKGV